MNAKKMNLGKYFKSEEIEDDGDVHLKISGVSEEEVGEAKELKWILHFSNSAQGLVLNKTNTSAIMALHGSETDDWTGKNVSIFVQPNVWKDKSGIRVRKEAPKDKSVVPF